MKRAKLMLAAIAVLAIVGGVYASKAKRNFDVYCSLTTTTAATSTVTSYVVSTTGIYTYCTQEFLAPITKKTYVTPNA